VETWTTSELAEDQGVSPSRIRQLCIEGRFPNAVKRGRDWMIPDDDVQAWLNSDRDRRFGVFKKKDL